MSPKIILLTFSVVYLILLTNRVIYLVKEYKLDKRKIGKNREMELGGIKAIHARQAGLGYSTVLEANIENKSEEYQYILNKRRNKFIYELVKAIITSITSIFTK